MYFWAKASQNPTSYFDLLPRCLLAEPILILLSAYLWSCFATHVKSYVVWKSSRDKKPNLMPAVKRFWGESQHLFLFNCSSQILNLGWDLAWREITLSQSEPQNSCSTSLTPPNISQSTTTFQNYLKFVDLRTLILWSFRSVESDLTFHRFRASKNSLIIDFHSVTQVSGWCQDGNTSSRTITEVKHLELNQFSGG